MLGTEWRKGLSKAMSKSGSTMRRLGFVESRGWALESGGSGFESCLGYLSARRPRTPLSFSVPQSPRLRNGMMEGTSGSV